MAAGCGAGCAVYTVYAPILLAPGTVLIKCCDFQRSLLAHSISDPSVLATRGAYVFIFSLCCLLSVCNFFTTPRAGPQSRPLPLVTFLSHIHILKFISILSTYVLSYSNFLSSTFNLINRPYISYFPHSEYLTNIPYQHTIPTIQITLYQP